jgi:hypothetical protein
MAADYHTLANGQIILSSTAVGWHRKRKARDLVKEMFPPKPSRLRNHPRPNSRKKKKARYYLEHPLDG